MNMNESVWMHEGGDDGKTEVFGFDVIGVTADVVCHGGMFDSKAVGRVKGKLFGAELYGFGRRYAARCGDGRMLYFGDSGVKVRLA